MHIASIWVEFRLALIVFLVSLVFGFLTGHWAICISIGLFAYIVWQLRQLMYLRRWTSSGADLNNVPNLYGSAYLIATQVCDIKKLSQHEQANLERLMSRFDAATKAMPDAMLIVDQSQTIEWANPAAKTLLAIDPYKDIGQRIDNIVRDPDITNYLANARFEEPFEFSSQRSTENDLMLRVITYDDGKKLLIVHDHADLMRLQNVRKAFVSNASHEMRTPLTVIIGYLETLSLREEMTGSTRRGVEGALEQAQRLKRLIEDLLSLSRLESMPVNKATLEVIDVSMLVNEGIDLVKSSDIYRDQQFQLRLDDSVQVTGDYRELQSAVQNILDNAVKYSPENSQIQVSWTRLIDNDSILTVQDYGEGIEETYIPRLTERFYRIDPGRSRDMGGTGLGLSIVKHVMERHGGELRISSRRGEGTKVQLYFPETNNGYTEQRVSA